jgi:hypothetical protein
MSIVYAVVISQRKSKMCKKIDINQVDKFYKQIKSDKNHRYRSWEHCFNYFLKPKKDIDIEKATLHLAFYLASWGMYRGSSYLLQKDYLIHKELLEKVLLSDDYKPLQTWDFSKGENDENIELLFELRDLIKAYYKEKITFVNGVKKEKLIVSDVLITKIILGVFGCVPAYDRYFIFGLKEYDDKFGFTFNKKSFENLIKVYRENKEAIDNLSKNLEFYKHQYPIMKILDMYFWQMGFEKENKNKDKIEK